MTRITLDGALSDKLRDLYQMVELCNPSGKVLGRFIPHIDTSDWEPVTPGPSEEELDRSDREEEWYTTEEVLAYLRSPEGE